MDWIEKHRHEWEHKADICIMPMFTPKRRKLYQCKTCKEILISKDQEER